MKSDEQNDLPKDALHTQQPGSIHAPASLQRTLQARIQRYADHASASLALEQFSAAMQDARWEVRCATIDNIARTHEPQYAHLLEQAIADSSPYVRLAALDAVTKMDTPNSTTLIYASLQDEDEQVRETARCLLAKKQEPESTAIVEKDHSKKERKHMDLYQSTIQPESQQSKTTRSIPSFFAHRGRLLIFAATLVLVMGTLMAAGFSWWNFSFGDPSLYKEVNQQQTLHGVTITITRVYADEGRTIVAYDISSHDVTHQYTLNNFDLLGSAPQQKAALSGTFGDPPENNTQHFYMVEQPFLVPAKTSTLTLTLNVGELIVTDTGKLASTTLPGPWHFVFTVPFHHENNKHVPNPIHGEVYLNQ